MKKFIFVLIIVFVLSSSVGCVSGMEKKSNEKTELLVSAAASLTDVMEELKKVYNEKDDTVNIIYTFGSSGVLQTQIEEGADVDIFMSAAQKQMNVLAEKELMINDTIKTLLVNKIVLIAPKDLEINISSFQDLSNKEIKRIAIGDPSNVPVGQYSEEIFTNLGLKDTIESKLVLGNDVRTVLTWVESGEVDLGIVYGTDAYTTDKVKIIAEAPEGSHREVAYPVGVVGKSKNTNKAKEFLDFLSTEKAGEIFKKYGFTMK